MYFKLVLEDFMLMSAQSLTEQVSDFTTTEMVFEHSNNYNNSYRFTSQALKALMFKEHAKGWSVTSWIQLMYWSGTHPIVIISVDDTSSNVSAEIPANENIPRQDVGLDRGSV